MVVRVKIEHGGLSAQILSGKAQEQVPFAAASALTQVAENARMNAVREMRQKLHAPTQWTLQSMWKKPATKRDLTAQVFLKDGKGGRKYVSDVGRSLGRVLVAEGGDRTRALAHLFSGGNRQWKRFEQRLTETGLLPSGMAAVPGEGCQLDANGNIPKGFIVQMLAYFRALRDRQQHMSGVNRLKFRAKEAKARGIGGGAVDYFVSRGRGNWFGRRTWQNGRLQHLPPGIWMRLESSYGSSLKPVIMFVRTPRYRRLIDLEQIVQATAARDWNHQFKIALDRAMQTARR